MTVHEVATAPSQPAAYLVTPKRMGRHTDIEPFEVRVADSAFAPADELARQIRRRATEFLVSKEFSVWVDLDKGVFEIDRGRFGKGTFAPVVGGVRIG